MYLFKKMQKYINTELLTSWMFYKSLNTGCEHLWAALVPKINPFIFNNFLTLQFCIKIFWYKMFGVNLQFLSG